MIDNQGGVSLRIYEQVLRSEKKNWERSTKRELDYMKMGKGDLEEGEGKRKEIKRIKTY